MSPAALRIAIVIGAVAQLAPSSARAGLKLERLSESIAGEPVEAFIVRADGREATSCWRALVAGSFPNRGRSVPELADQTSSAAAVNANFYREDSHGAQQPIGLVVHGGRVLSLPQAAYPTVGVIDGRLEWDRVTAALRLTAVDSSGHVLGRAKVCRVNAPATADCAALWLNPKESGRTQGLTVEAHGEGPKLGGESHRLAPDGAWLVEWRRLPRGVVRIDLQTGLTGQRLGAKWSRVTEAVSGSHLLKPDGTLPAAEHPWALSRQPRTLIGVDADGRPWVAVFDGRREGSHGVSLDEAFSFLRRKLQAAWALNLDGGGSSSLMFERRLVNQPSDRFPRTVAVGWGCAPSEP